MVDPKILFQLNGCLHQELVARMTLRHNEVRRQADFCHTYRPDVQIMQFRDTGKRAKKTANSPGIDPIASRSGLQEGRYNNANRHSSIGKHVEVGPELLRGCDERPLPRRIRYTRPRTLVASYSLPKLS
jgi:hypothetical protein